MLIDYLLLRQMNEYFFKTALLDRIIRDHMARFLDKFEYFGEREILLGQLECTDTIGSPIDISIDWYLESIGE